MGADTWRGKDGVNRRIQLMYRGVNGVNRYIKEQWRGYSGANRRVFYPPYIIFQKNDFGTYTGTLTQEDRGTYLWGELSGKNNTNTDTNRPYVRFRVANLKNGDVVKITWSASQGASWSDHGVYSSSLGYCPIISTSAFTNRVETLNITVDGAYCEVFVNHGSIYTLESRWIKVHEILVNGKKLYPYS